MDQASLIQKRQPVQELLSEDPDQSCAKTTELVLLDQLVQVDTEELENQTQVLLVYEGVFQPQQMMIIVLVELRIELYRCQRRAQDHDPARSYQVQNRDLHHALVEVSSAILDDLHGNNLLCLEILAFHDLAECSLAQNVQYQIPIPVTPV